MRQFLAEAANGPTTPEADLILRERDIPVLPDIYASGGALLGPPWHAECGRVLQCLSFRWLSKDAQTRRLMRVHTGRLTLVLGLCAGGVVVSFFEWVQNLQNLR